MPVSPWDVKAELLTDGLCSRPTGVALSRPRARWCPIMFTSAQIEVAVPSRLLAVSGARRYPRRPGVPPAKVQSDETLPPARCPRCESVRTLLAYELGGKQCHVCHACCYVWDVDKTSPPTPVN